MQALIWWLVPIGTLIVGLIYLVWFAKPNKTSRPDKAIAQRHAFENAVQKITPEPTDSAGEPKK